MGVGYLSGLRRGNFVARNEIMARMNTNPIDPSPTNTTPDYAARIKAERQKRAWTQEHLAEVSGLSARTIQRLECGEAPSPETLRMLAAAFGISTEEMGASAVRTVFKAEDKNHAARKWVLTCLAFILLDIGLACWFGRFSFIPKRYPPIDNIPAIIAVVFALFCLNFPWIITGYALKNGKLLVHHLGWAKKYDLAHITGISICPQASLGSGPVTVYFHFSDVFHSKQMGYFRNYVTDIDKAVLVEFGKKKIVVTPDDPNAFIAAVRENAKTICADREIPAPACIADFSTSNGDYSDKIHEERAKRSWTQEQLADKASLSIRTVQRLERGTPPSAETLRLLAVAFGITVAEMEAKLLRKHFKATWPEKGKKLRSAVIQVNLWILCVCPAVYVMITLDQQAVHFLWLVSGLSLINAYNQVSGFSVKDGKLIVNQFGSVALKYDLAKLTSIEINPNAMMGAIPLSFPLVILSPWCRSALLGTFRAFLTDEAHCVVMEFGDKKIVVTPDEPQAFVEAVREELRNACAENHNCQ
jgi:transcriptional regulator with XRE-family HTH domain